MTTSELIEKVRRQDEKLDALAEVVMIQSRHQPGCIPQTSGIDCTCGLAQATAKLMEV